ncbi:MAG TPA: GTP-binding protein [Xanthomonadales bacterium]|nr:GTP-binding protein [Xanthomonadales bacterium]
MSVIARLRAWWRGEPFAPGAPDHLETAADSLRALLDDPATPGAVREALASDYEQVRAMLEKLERGDVHIAVFGRVSVGKSALLNALVGERAFEVGVLHGTTRVGAIREWRAIGDHGTHLIDTPGIDELSGESREKLAHETAARADLVLFVVDGDIGEVELSALRVVAAEQRPLVLVLNKVDRYTREERAQLLARLRERCAGIVAPTNVIEAAAEPRPRRVLRVLPDGTEQEASEPQAPDVAALADRIVDVLAREGGTLAALNAALFAGRLSDEVGRRVAALRADLAERLIRNYCLAKAMAVGLNPIPVADLLAAAALDVGLVVHLARVYRLPMTSADAGKLVATISASLAATMGAVWGTHLVASALKGASAGLSTVLTAAAQGALAWYATVLVGRSAQLYLANGCSWGERGPKNAVRGIVESLDRDSILAEAREEILRRLRKAPAGA